MNADTDGLHRRFVRTQTLVSVIINTILSAAVAAASGVKDLAVDFIPQAFMMILMSSLALTIITRKAVATGKLRPTAAAAISLPYNPFLRAVTVAAASAWLFGGLAFAVAKLTGAGVPPLPELMALKIAFAVVVTAVVAPFVVRSALAARQP